MAAAAEGCPILVVEDDAELRDMMVAMLQLAGFEPRPAADGLDALQQLKSGEARPRLILLDMMMPRMDGWEFCRERAKDPGISRIPVVVLSAAPRSQLQVPVSAVLSKPFDYDSLLATIRAYC